MATTSHLEITLLEQSQAQKEITINEALARIDAVLNSGAIDRDLATPPVSPAEGDVYIVAASPTGAWAGKAGQVAYYDQIWRFIAPRTGMLLWVNDEAKHVLYNGASWQIVSTTPPVVPVASCGRLTLSSGVPIAMGNVTGATTIYFTPFRGNRLSVYDGAQWQAMGFGEVSLAVPATANTMYDVWGYMSGGTIALEASVWTNDTTRATALALHDGVLVKQGDATRRYLGSFRTGSVSGQTEDSEANRLVWNYYNRASRGMRVQDGTASWAYSTNSWRQANGNTANQLNFVVGVAEDAVEAYLLVSLSNSTATVRNVFAGIGLDSVGVNVSFGLSAPQSPASTARFSIYAQYSGVISAGHHYLSWIERGAGADVQTWMGGAYSGLCASVMG